MTRTNAILPRQFLGAIFVVLLVCLNVGLVKAVAAEAERPPQVVATEFYAWYLKTIESQQDPMTDRPDQMSEYVAKPLLTQLRRMMAQEGGLEADYFIHAQDYLDDWSTTISATNSTIRGNSATLELTLGASPKTRQHLALTMTREQRRWKIRKVRLLK
jgi:hypothetical protein